MLHHCLLSLVINSKYQHRAIPESHSKHRKDGIPWTSCLLLLAGRQFSSLFYPQKQPAFLDLCFLTNSFLLCGPGRLWWNTTGKALKHPIIYQTFVMTSVSTLSGPSSHTLQDSSPADFQRVSFSFQNPLLSPKLLAYSCLLGAELTCKLSRLLKLNWTWGLEVSSCHMEQGGRAGGSARLCGFRATDPAPSPGLGQWAPVPPGPYNLCNKPLFRCCSPETCRSRVRRDTHKIWPAILGLKWCP